MFANTWLARTRGALKLCAWKLGLLYNYLAGGDHTQIRCVKAGITEDPSPVCRYCDTEEEGQEHTIWRCPCWVQQRRPLTDMLTQQQWNALPPHTRCCGIIEESEELLSLQAELSRDPPQPIPRPPPEGPDGDQYTYYTDPHTGCRWVYAGTDGACSHQAVPLLARAAFGVYYGSQHRLNHAARVNGLTQNAQRAETLAILHLVATAKRPVHVFVDNQAVVEGFQAMLDGKPPPTDGPQSDLLAPYAPCTAGQARLLPRPKSCQSPR